jgi:hypothetical protein
LDDNVFSKKSIKVKIAEREVALFFFFADEKRRSGSTCQQMCKGRLKQGKLAKFKGKYL